MSEENGSAVAKKIAKIMGEIDSIPKNGHNAHYNYDYVREEDVTDIIREKLSNHNLALFQNVVDSTEGKVGETSKGNDRIKTTLWVEYTFVDGDTGESFTCKMPCAGIDTEDKGIYKAITGGNKYFLLKTFQISAGGDDPELDAHKGNKSSKSSHTGSSGPRKVPYGNSEGTPIPDADTSTLEWLLGTLDEEKLNDEKYGEQNRKLKEEVEQELAKREQNKTKSTPKQSRSNGKLTMEDAKLALDDTISEMNESDSVENCGPEEAQNFAIWWDNHIEGDDDDRYRFLSKLTERDIETTKDLYQGELKALRELVKKRKEPFIKLANDFVAAGTKDLV